MLRLPQHIASNVVKGLDPQRGVGFQTLAASEELLGTEDLRVLEEMAPYYQASRADRQAGTPPVREMFYRLPSGSYAVTRIEDWGADPHGRAGNSLAHSLVVAAQLAENSRWDPLALLDYLNASRAPELPPPGTVPPFEIAQLPPAEVHAVLNVDMSWLGCFIGALLGEWESPRKPLLTIAARPDVRTLIQTLRWALPLRELKDVTFATHFYRDCDLHRDHFRLVTIESSAEAPTESEHYYLTGWKYAGRFSPPSAFSVYLADELSRGNWSAVQVFRDRVDGIRQGASFTLPDEPDVLAVKALAELVSAEMAPALLGKPGLISQLFDTHKPDRRLAEALLLYGGPVAICGGPSESEVGASALRAVENAAGKQAWREWSQRWAGEMPETAASGKSAWWKVWKR